MQFADPHAQLALRSVGPLPERAQLLGGRAPAFTFSVVLLCLQGAQAGPGARLHPRLRQRAAGWVCSWSTEAAIRGSDALASVASPCIVLAADMPDRQANPLPSFPTTSPPSTAAIGLCNLFAAAFSTIPTAGSISRAAVVNPANGKTRELGWLPRLCLLPSQGCSSWLPSQGCSSV